jgi:hypothetical protein
MSACNFTTEINGTDCIGDSRGLINQNFLNLDTAICELSASTFLRDAIGGLEETDFNQVRLNSSLRTCYNFYPAKFNNSTNPYENRVLGTYSSTHNLPASFTSPTQNVLLEPLNNEYPNLDIPLIDAALIKFRVHGTLFRPDGSLGIRTRRKNTEPWYTVLETFAAGPENIFNVGESTTEIIYFDKTTNRFEWELFDTGVTPFPVSGGITQNAEYNVTIELLGYYFRVE